MADDGEEDFAGFKDVLRGTVSMYRDIWDEVERKFSDLPVEDRHRIFSVIAPFIGHMLTVAMNESLMEEVNKHRNSHRKKEK